MRGASPSSPLSAAESLSAAGADPAQAAIERAKQARATQTELSPLEKLQQSIASLEKRIAKASEKLAKAEANGDDTVDILKESVGKLEQKLNDAKQQLAEQEQA